MTPDRKNGVKQVRKESAFDFKKEYRDLYLPGDKPGLVTVPAMNFIMLDGAGDPHSNDEFEQSVEVLYGLSYTIKMSKKKGSQPEGYFEYVVPPLEGLWWIGQGIFSLAERDNWQWTLMIRQPEFVTGEFFKWACGEFKKKKPGLPVEKARLATFEEGLCVQALHTGPYATEPETMAKMDAYMKANRLRDKLHEGGKHHEVYLSDPRKSKPERLKTVLRHPVEKF
jgi:hypothetical protein